jgi:PKD repeat protein
VKDLHTKARPIRWGAGLALLVALAGGLTGCWWLFINEAPTAAFTASATTGQAPLVVNFSAVLSTDPDGTITDFEWDFGDGANGTGEAASHTYTAGGTFTVVLRITDNDGAQATAQKTINVAPPEPPGPAARFTASPSSGTSPLSVTFDATGTTYHLTPLTYTWSFGDGGSGVAATTSHLFVSSTARTYTVTLTVRGPDGTTGTATGTVSVTGTGGGGTPTGAPSARFAILFDDPGPPVVDYTNTQVAPVRVWLDPGDSKAATGRTIASYAWSFGDGAATSSIGPDIQEHTYSTGQTSKVFSVTLVVIDDKGANNSITKTVSVKNYQPVAGFEVADDLDYANAGAVLDWWTDDEDLVNDNRVTYKGVLVANHTVWIRSQEIVNAAWLLKDRDDPTPNGANAKPSPEFSSTDGNNMCFDPEGQTWKAGGKPDWFPNRAWGIRQLKIQWGDGNTEFVAFQDGADTTASHVYNFGGTVASWTITVTAIDYLGAESAPFQRTITMSEAA